MCDRRTWASYGVVETDDKETIVRVIQNLLETFLSKTRQNCHRRKMMHTIAADPVCVSDVQAGRIQRWWFGWCGGRDRRRTQGRWWWRLKTTTHDQKHCHTRGVCRDWLLDWSDWIHRQIMEGYVSWDEDALTNSFSRKTSILWSLIQSLNFS